MTPQERRKSALENFQGIKQLETDIINHTGNGAYTRAGTRLAPLIINGFPNPLQHQPSEMAEIILALESEWRADKPMLGEMNRLQCLRALTVLNPRYQLSTDDLTKAEGLINNIRVGVSMASLGLLDNIRHQILPDRSPLVDNNTYNSVVTEMKKSPDAFWQLEAKIFEGRYSQI